MSEQINRGLKAEHRSIQIGDVSLEVAMLPDGSYRLSQTEVAGAIDKQESSVRSFRSSKWLKSLLGESGTVACLTIEGSNKTIAPISLDLAALYWQKWASDGNPKALALIVALIKRSLYDRANEAFGVKCTESERSRQLREDLSEEGQARIEAMHQSLEQQANTQPETATERELKLLIRLRELDLELERLRRKTQRFCLLPDGSGKNTIPGITGGAVLEDAKRILNTSDDEEAIRAIYQVGFHPQSGVWSKVQVEKWVIGMPETKYHKLLHLLHQKQASMTEGLGALLLGLGGRELHGFLARLKLLLAC